MYGALGAGPGETVTYLVDLPLPWGRDTELTLPIDALVEDAWVSVEPAMNRAIAKGAVVIAVVTAAAILGAAWWIKKG